MEFPPSAWIQNEELAATIEESNATQRTYLREQLIPFIKQIHERNLNNPDRLIPLSEFIGNHVGLQLDYKIAKYKKDIAHPESKFAAPKLSERPDYMQHVNPEFIATLTPAERSILRDSFHNLYDKQRGGQLYPHNAGELGIWQVGPEWLIHQTVDADYQTQKSQFRKVDNPGRVRFEDRFIQLFQIQDDVKGTPCAIFNRVELLVAKFVIREILHRGTWNSFQHSQGIMPLAKRFIYEDDIIFGHPVFGILAQTINTQIRVQEMGQVHSAIRGIALAFLRMHHVGLVQTEGILGLDFGLTEWADIPNYQDDNHSIEKLRDKILRHGTAASAQAYRIGSWPASENSRSNFERPLFELIEICYSTVMTTMHFIHGKKWDELAIPIPESAQWVEDELEAHRLKRQFLKEKNWSFCGVYNCELDEELPSNWEGKMIRLLPNWRSMRLPSLSEDSQIQMPKQEKPWAELIETGMEIEFIPIRAPK